MEGVKANLPNFVNIISVSRGRNEGEWVELNARINPYHITSYHEVFLKDYKGSDLKKVTCFYVAGNSYCVDMTIEEADQMIQDIDRSLYFKEND